MSMEIVIRLAMALKLLKVTERLAPALLAGGRVNSAEMTAVLSSFPALREKIDRDSHERHELVALSRAVQPIFELVARNADLLSPDDKKEFSAISEILAPS